MKTVIALFAFLCATSLNAQTKKFEGTFFTVSYPSNFSATKCGDPSFCNQLTVTSPDKKVSFYVFAPQWNGEPDMEIKENEKETSRNVTEKDGVTMTEVTYADKAGKYSRSFVDYENTELNTRKTFGVKYTDMAAYNKYKAQYLAFKKSLQQFAD